MDIPECDCEGCVPECTEDLSERLIKIVDQYDNIVDQFLAGAKYTRTRYDNESTVASGGYYTGATLEPKQERAWHQRRRVLRVRWYFVHLWIAIRGQECDEW